MKLATPPELLYIVQHSQLCLQMASNFLDRAIAEEDENASVFENNFMRRKQLVNRFQKLIMDIYCDPMFLDTVTDPDEDPDQDALDVYAIYQAFIQHYPIYEVVAIVPMNLTGTVGFVLQHKSMTPKQKS